MRENRRAGGRYARLIVESEALVKLPLHSGEHRQEEDWESGFDSISSALFYDRGEVLNIFNRTCFMFNSVKYI